MLMFFKNNLVGWWVRVSSYVPKLSYFRPSEGCVDFQHYMGTDL